MKKIYKIFVLEHEPPGMNKYKHCIEELILDEIPEFSSEEDAWKWYEDKYFFKRSNDLPVEIFIIPKFIINQ
jgi:hypothetical protein